MLQPAVVGIADRRYAVFPACVLAQPLPAPVRDVERRIGEDEIEALVLQFVTVKAALIVPADVGVNAAHREVHFAQPPGRVIALLAVNRELADATSVCLQEPLGLNKHPAGAAARVIDATLDAALLVREWLQHLDQHVHDGARRIEFTTALAFRASESAQEILVDTAKHVSRFSALPLERDAGNEVNELAQHDLVER